MGNTPPIANPREMRRSKNERRHNSPLRAIFFRRWHTHSGGVGDAAFRRCRSYMAGIAPSSPISDSPIPAKGPVSSSRKRAASASDMLGATLSHRPAILGEFNTLIAPQNLSAYSTTPTSPYRVPRPPFFIGRMYSAGCTPRCYGGVRSAIFQRPPQSWKCRASVFPPRDV